MSKNKTLFIFPGQGSQYPGIGRDLCEQYTQAGHVYEQASDVLGYDIKNLSFSDPNNQINQTRYTQPVLLTHAVACLNVFNYLTNNQYLPTYTAGHSLGEYSALVASDVLSFKQALSLVNQRGKLMSEYGCGGMTAFSASKEEIITMAEKHYCAIAGCNLPDQTVVGGNCDDLAKLEAQMHENFPRKRFTRLNTEAAFHTYYMICAAQKFRNKLQLTQFMPAKCDVLSNYTGTWHPGDADAVKANLFYQLFNPVMWHQNLLTVTKTGVDRIIEFGGGIGTGKTAAEKRPNLEGIIKKTYRHNDFKPAYYCAINCHSIEKTIADL